MADETDIHDVLVEIRDLLRGIREDMVKQPTTFHYHYGAPPPTPVPPGLQNGYSCAFCQAWVPFGTTHICYRSPQVPS